GPFPLEIINRHGKPLPPDAVGEIVFDVTRVKEPTLRAELLRKPTRKGRYLYTGDLGRLDADGNLFIVGRKTRLIKVGARRVIPAEVEAVLRSHPEVMEAIVHPVHAGENHENVGAVVVRKGDVTVDELIRHCAERLDGYQCPKQIVFQRNLPRNAHGKVIRYRADAKTSS
ncbi:MAG: AMP-binding protein, partial [Deltaproteobacteria bacterium]|nr:AMP-binding protein [Deltaproteobacteria bacterium]